MSAWIGYTLSLGGCLCNAVGYLFMKIAHKRAAATLLIKESTTTLHTENKNNTLQGQEFTTVLNQTIPSATITHHDLLSPLTNRHTHAQGHGHNHSHTEEEDIFHTVHASPSIPIAFRHGTSFAVASTSITDSSHVSINNTPIILDDVSESKVLTYFYFWQFWLGIAIIASGAGLGVVSFNFASQSSLGPIGAVTIVFIEILSFYILHETLTWIDIIACILMLSGVALALTFSVPDPISYNLDGILTLFERLPVLIFVCLLFPIFLFSSYFLIRWSNIPVKNLEPRIETIDAILRPAIAGLLVGITGVFVKATTETISSAIADHSNTSFYRPEPYIFLIALGISLFFQVTTFNSGLARYPSNIVAPIYQITLVFSDVVCGWIVWNEIAQQSNASIGAFSAGCILSIIGIIILTSRIRPDDNTEILAKIDENNISIPSDTLRSSNISTEVPLLHNNE